MTETQSNYDSDTQPGALFTADTFFNALENGAFTVDYWDTRNGWDGTTTTAPDGATDYGDGGLLSSGNCNSSNACEPPLNTPFASYYGLQMLSKVAQPGDTLVKAASDNQLVSVHAARNADGGLSVELVNKDPANAYTVNLSYAGWTPSGAPPTVYTYGDEAASITTAQQGTAGTQVDPAVLDRDTEAHPVRGQSRRCHAVRTRQPHGRQRHRHHRDDLLAALERRQRHPVRGV